MRGELCLETGTHQLLKIRIRNQQDRAQFFEDQSTQSSRLKIYKSTFIQTKGTKVNSNPGSLKTSNPR